jgi:enoyl-CoA hydratase/carnithine racemase
MQKGMTTSTRQIILQRHSLAFWRVTFDHPPLNIFGPETIPELSEIIAELETDEQVKVVVFDSAVECFFLTHYNFLAKAVDTGYAKCHLRLVVDEDNSAVFRGV